MGGKGNRPKRKSGNGSSVQNKSKKSPMTSTHENNTDDGYPSASKSEASTENKSQRYRLENKPQENLSDGYLNDQKFWIQLVVLLITVPIVNILMKSDKVEKYCNTVERKINSTQKKFSELDNKFTMAENKLSDLEKLLNGDHFTRLFDEEWEKRKELLTMELEKKHNIFTNTLNNELENAYTKIEDILQQLNIYKQQQHDKLNKRERIFKGNMESKLDAEIKYITQKWESKHSDLIKRVEDAEYRLDKVNGQMDSFSVDMSSAMKSLKEVKGKQSKMKTKIKSNEDTLIIINEKVHRFSTETDILKNEIERLDVNSSELSNRLKSNENKTSEVKTQLHSNYERVNGQLKNLKINTQKVKGVCFMLLKRVNGTEDRLDGVDRLLIAFSADIYDISLYIFVLLFAVGIAVFFAVYDKLIYKQHRTVDSTVSLEVTNGHKLKSGPNKRIKKDDQFSSALIEKLSLKNKEKGVGIISFSASTQENHQRSLKAIDIPSSLPVQAYVILKLDDLMLVQPYTQIIIFVDFNERNIILENPETEIGDIRRRTTEVLLEVGCDVFVVYFRDKSSKSLPEENLYNISLYSIEKQTVLSRLRSRGRVFSVYDTFHPQQVQMLNNCLK